MNFFFPDKMQDGNIPFPHYPTTALNVINDVVPVPLLLHGGGPTAEGAVRFF